MSDTEILTYKQWVDSIEGKGSEHGYITYVKEKEKEREEKKERFNKMSEEEKEREKKREREEKSKREEKKEREETELKGADSMSGGSYDSMSAEEVQERLLVLTSISSRDIASINDNVRFFKYVFIFGLVISILSIIVLIGG